MRTETAFVLTILVLCYAVVSGLVKRLYVAPALIFVAFGMVLGPFGFGLLEARTDTQSFTILAQLALTVILVDSWRGKSVSCTSVSPRSGHDSVVAM